MKYQWKTAGIWKLNHLVYGENVACFNFKLTQPETLILNYNKAKPKCQSCKPWAKFNSPAITIRIPNVLHINRKIFI